MFTHGKQIIYIKIKTIFMHVILYAESKSNLDGAEQELFPFLSVS